MSDLILDKSVFKALSDESRIKILKSLYNRQKTQSELADELNFAVSTIAKHVDVMEAARLVKRKAGSKKWIYYELTSKGRLLFPAEKQKQTSVFIFALCAAFFMISAGALSFYSVTEYPIIGTKITEKQVQTKTLEGQDALEKMTVQEQTIVGMTQVQQINALAVLGIIAGAAVLVLVLVSKKPTISFK